MNFGLGFGSLGILYVAYFVLIAFVHISFAVGVYLDTQYMIKTGGVPFLVSRVIWTLATLLGGIFAVLAYWLIHHSSLRSNLRPWMPRE